MSPCRLGVPPPAPAMQAYFVGVKTGDILEYSTWAIALCVDAALFAQGDEHGYLEQRYGRNRVEVWTTLVRSLEIWYAQRPHEFQAIIELYPRDGKLSDDEFPTLVFTNGAAILANQLHHTGMLLLLQNKPRFTGPMNLNSSFRSALWHTHRICGIATNNDRAECWDPSLLASFLVAARLATHRSQHTVIISSLERVCKLTGWNISHQINILEHKWRLAEG
ncbi:hypothetical protein CC78DRAFT_535820 [Lojkania enalia]|uniref:Transcription factor domain-containing protein n=1 Tax=Lojkania enalia TaxID=147567 RepID=A0A9P4K332_9PLEO|nr:hypothetical protein CC78DRAFT_535820 [Didymosphaeria enalia]